MYTPCRIAHDSCNRCSSDFGLQFLINHPQSTPVLSGICFMLSFPMFSLLECVLFRFLALFISTEAGVAEFLMVYWCSVLPFILLFLYLSRNRLVIVITPSAVILAPTFFFFLCPPSQYICKISSCSCHTYHSP